MNKKRYSLFLWLLFFSLIGPVSNLRAQEAILSEISYLYLNKLIAAAKENYPRLKSFESEIKAAKSDLSGVKISWLEPFSFQYVSRSNRASSNLVNVTTADILNGYQIGISINPGSLLAKPSQIKKAKEQVRIAQYNRDEYDLSLEAAVKTRYFAYIQAQKSVIPATNAYLDAENNFKSIKIAYQRAEVTLQIYNEASIAFNQALTTKLQIEGNYLTAKAALEELTVKKLEEIK
ncbi:TolC family protein [Pedobacter sp. MC2016-14]|uniref:TolC family protein n=1 Tax=Pedobacter sp. MC2016-14 TaxID=2897327 RepID=UPI001E42A496|nr:TolC family protein [Pedobacter sp. MC2016-14]MCD0490221.1 TolC family protein [Pedobacter sp. MC2016-14]